jgi:hypothetical protein
MITRDQLSREYLDYINNYLTMEKFAEHRGLHLEEAKLLVQLGKESFEKSHPES